MKTILVAAGMLAAATFAGGSEASAAGKNFGLTISGPNGYIEIGANGRGRGYEYDVYDGRDHSRRGDHRNHYAHGRCLKRKQIRRRLNRRGWFGFHDLRTRRGAFVVNAWRRNGHEYKLRVERCTGEILRAKHVGRDHRRYSHRAY